MTGDDDQVVSDIDLAMLFKLAPIVGESGSEVVTRAIPRIARGNRRAYRAELNRLTAKFIAALERQYSANT